MNHNKYIFETKVKKSKWEKAAIAAVYILVGVAIFQYLYIDSSQVSVAEVKKTMPIVLIQDIEPEIKTEGNTSINKDDDNSSAEINHTWLGTNQYNVEQYNEGNILYINYYELRNNLLVKPLTKELPTSNIFNIRKSKLKQIKYEGLDQVYIYKNENIQVISASKGHQVMCLYYVGEQPQEKLLKVLAKALN